MGRDWQVRERPPRLEGRYEFPGYKELRAFLDRVAELSEQLGLHPDLGFGRTYVNVTVYADDGAQAVGKRQYEFAGRLDELAGVDGMD